MAKTKSAPTREQIQRAKELYRPTRKEIREELESEVLGGLENIESAVNNFLRFGKLKQRIKRISDKRLHVAQAKVEEVSEQINYIFDSL